MLQVEEHAEIDLEGSLSEDLAGLEANHHQKDEIDLHERANDIVFAIQAKLLRLASFHLFLHACVLHSDVTSL